MRPASIVVFAAVVVIDSDGFLGFRSTNWAFFACMFRDVKRTDGGVGESLVAAAQALEAQAVRAIAGGCGFFGYFQA